MATRQFVDSNGVTWAVWGTIPSGSSARVTKFASGWLTFENDSSLRRLTPLPANWETVSDARLELMCRAATEVRRHTGPFPRMLFDDDTDASDSDGPRKTR